MRELAPETMAQLMEQLNDIAKGAPAAQAAKPGSGGDVDDVREALVETAFLIGAVDGEVSPLEIAQFGEAIESAFGESDVDVQAMLAKMSSRLEAEGWDKRMKAVARALEGSHKTEGAYRIAVGVAFIDDDVAHAEAAALEAFARALGIADDRAHAIMGEVREELFG